MTDLWANLFFYHGYFACNINCLIMNLSVCKFEEWGVLLNNVCLLMHYCILLAFLSQMFTVFTDRITICLSWLSCAFHCSDSCCHLVSFVRRDIFPAYVLRYIAMESASRSFVLDQSNLLLWRMHFVKKRARYVGTNACCQNKFEMTFNNFNATSTRVSYSRAPSTHRKLT